VVDFKRVKCLVVKIGSALLSDSEGKPHAAWLQSLAADIAQLKKQGTSVIIVSSGAVALGKKVLGLKGKKLRLEEKQAAAACGQPLLMETYGRTLGKEDLSAAQILLSIEDSENRRRYLNAKSTLTTLLGAGVVPVINENDTVATEELRFGDNDRLAARVAQMVGADLLVLLSDVDGLYTANPRLDKKAQHLPVVETIDAKIERMAGGSLSDVGSGGMATKIAAAKIAVRSGCHTVILHGEAPAPLSRLMKGEKHTIFISGKTPLSARKHWIADTLHVSGTLVVDDGAAKALAGGKSLLPAGVKEIKGRFERGDAVAVTTLEGAEIARGLVAYSAEDARRIIGHNSKEIETILGFAGRDALIHRDDLVLL
jgi:glutamate 5-kinase